MPDKGNAVLGKKLKELRVGYKMTQEDIAHVLGMSRTSFSKYENGASNPPLAVMRKLAAIYKVKLDYLIYDDEAVLILNDGKNTEEPDLNCSITSFSDLNHDEKMMIMKMRLMSSEHKKEIKTMIDKIEE